MTLKERCLTSLKGELPNSVPIAKYLFNQKKLQEELSYTSVLYGGNAQARLIVQLGIGGYGFLMNGFCGIGALQFGRMGGKYGTENYSK